MRARLLVMTGAVPLIMFGLGIGLAANVPTAVVLLSVIAAGTAAFMANYFSFTQEVTPRHTGLVVGYPRRARQPVRGAASSRSPAR